MRRDRLIVAGRMAAAARTPFTTISMQLLRQIRCDGAASALLPKFVKRRSTTSHELRKQEGTSKLMILVPLFDLKFLIEFAATAVGTSNRRH